LDLNWFESFLYGLFSGLTDILPVSAEAHRILMLKCFGIQSHTELMKLFAHLGVFGAMYFSCRKQIVRIHRARRLARVPKRRRRRPLDTRSLMDFSLLRTMLIPVILGFFLNRYTEPLKEKLIWIAALLFLNGIILYIPQFFSSPIQSWTRPNSSVRSSAAWGWAARWEFCRAFPLWVPHCPLPASAAWSGATA